MKKVIIIGLVLIVVIAGVLIGYWYNKNKLDNNNITILETAKQNDDITKKIEESSKKNFNDTIIEIAYNYLSNERKSIIINKDNPIINSFKTGGNYIVVDNHDEHKTIANKEIIAVDFTTNRKNIPNNIVVILDKETNEPLGYGLVD